MKVRAILFAVLTTVSLQLKAYEIGPSILGFDPVHQMISTLALGCLQEGSSSSPKNCLELIENCSNPSDIENGFKICINKIGKEKLFLSKYSSEELAYATRWPDDPTEETGFRGGAKFGVKMKVKCEDILKKKKALDITDGLLCNSHFGEFQFWHAQASTQDENSEVTRQKIFDWIKFNYNVAIENIPLNEGYCKYFEDNPSSISNILKPEAFPYCEERPYWGWVPRVIAKPYPGYDIATLYGMKCKNPFSSKTCTEERINSQEDRKDKTVLSATGAILHLIQDAYSQSHVERGSCSNNFLLNGNLEPPISKIECKPVTMFTNYSHYDTDAQSVSSQVNHDISDVWPYIAESCFSEERLIDDPITASSKVLWHISNKSPWEKVEKDLMLVFNEMPKNVKSGKGFCY